MSRDRFDFREQIGARRLLLEALCVALGTFGLALVANSLSPHGLRLSRNYFPTGPLAAPVPPPPPSTAAELAEVSPVRTRIEERGLQVATDQQVLEWYNDARYAAQQILFIDARRDADFEAGHIPGAHQLDHYHAERFLPRLLPACEAAEIVVVYCRGGECEDSEFAAMTLAEMGVPLQNLHVYLGGLEEWRSKQRPIETGSAAAPETGSPP